jgi:hypothetical protein
MSDDYEADDEDAGDGGNGYAAPMADPVLIALELCKLANNKTVAAAVKKLRRLDQQYADIQAKCTALTAHAESTKAALDARATELDAREGAITAREDEFASSVAHVRDELRAYHNHLDETHRQLIHRIMATAGILSGWNPQLQDLPTWQQLRRQIADLPDDLPGLFQPATAAVPIDALSDTHDDPHADRHGNAFLGTITRDVSHKRGAAP